MTKRKRFILRLHEGNITYSQKRIEEDADQKRSAFFKTVGMASELGFIIAFPLVGGILLGTFFDKKLSSYPKMTLSLLFLGVIIAFYNLYIVMQDYLKKEK